MDIDTAWNTSSGQPSLYQRPTFSISSGIVCAHIPVTTIQHGARQYLIADIFYKTDIGQTYLILLQHSSSLRASGPVYRCLFTEHQICGRHEVELTERLVILEPKMVSDLQWEWRDIYISSRPHYRAGLDPLNQNRLNLTRLKFGGSTQLRNRPFFINPSLFAEGNMLSRILSLERVGYIDDTATWTSQNIEPRPLTLFLVPPLQRQNLSTGLPQLNATVGASITIGLCLRHTSRFHYCTFRLFQCGDSGPIDVEPRSHDCLSDHLCDRQTISEEMRDKRTDNIVSVHVSFNPRPLALNKDCQELHIRYVAMQLVKTSFDANILFVEQRS